jgi:hypothetical protein
VNTTSVLEIDVEDDVIDEVVEKLDVVRKVDDVATACRYQ